MNDVIFETVVTTLSPAGVAHVAPMGIRYDGSDRVVLLPFKPSTTLDNIVATRVAVLNVVTDGRIFAGCVTGRRDWPTAPAERIAGVRLQAALSHLELQLAHLDDDVQRPRLSMTRVHARQHAPYPGMNRAQAAVLEGAVLVSRLHLLPRARIVAEMAHLQTAVDKTAGAAEHEAWRWLTDAVARHDPQEPQR